MSSNTPNLGLLKKDPMVDGNETFNIETMLNENWDKIDEAVGNVQVEIPDSSTTQKGIVQLSNATDGTRENVAATEKAVKDAALQAKSYTDQQISLVTETGIPKLVSYPLLVTATADNQKVFEIPLDLFDANTDTLLVAINRAALDPTQYTVTNTVRNEAGEVTQRAKITLLSGVASTSELAMVVLKNVPLGEDGAINGAVLAVDSIPINRVNGLEDQLREAFQAGNERKAEVVAALVAIGVPASTSETWAQLIPKIAAVIGATGDATAADILAGKTASNANGPLTGSMPNRGAVTLTPGKTDQTIPAGYHNGQGAVAGVPVPAANVLAGTTIAGTAGTMPNRGAGGTITPGTTNITKQAGYYSSDIIIRGEPNKIPGNIKQGVSIDGVVGTLSPAMPSNGEFNISNGDGNSIGTFDTLMYTIPSGANMYTMSASGEWYWMLQNVAAKIYVILKDSNNMEVWALQGEPNTNTYNIRFTLAPLMIHYATRTISMSATADQSAFINSTPTLPANFNLNGPVRIIMRIVTTYSDLYNYARCTKKYWQA